MNKNRVILMALVSIGIAGMAYFLLTPFLPAYLVPNCQSKSLAFIAERSNVPVMAPAYLPEGYVYRAGQLIQRINEPEHFIIYYSPSNLPCSEIEGKTTIAGYYFTQVNMTSLQYIDQQMNNLKSQYGSNLQRFSFGEGTEAVGAQADIVGNPGTFLIVAVDNAKTSYEIQTSFPLDEAVKIGKSLQLAQKQ
jgi:hypothetical protein